MPYAPLHSHCTLTARLQDCKTARLFLTHCQPFIHHSYDNSATPRPTILNGSLMGAIAGKVLQSLLGFPLQVETYALIGAVALLGGLQRSTISLVVIILEGTGQIQLLIPVCTVTIAARIVGDRFNHGVYGLVLPRPYLITLPTPSHSNFLPSL